jgi:putative hemolysin
MNSRLHIMGLVLILSALIISGCGTSAVQPTTGLANPASVYCEEQGYTLEMRTDENGTYGVCIFPDGSECEEWAFYRGECGPETVEVQPTEVPITPTDAVVQVPDPARARDAALNHIVTQAGLTQTVKIEIYETVSETITPEAEGRPRVNVSPRTHLIPTGAGVSFPPWLYSVAPLRLANHAPTDQIEFVRWLYCPGVATEPAPTPAVPGFAEN